jgi:hypothetical protein
MKTEVEHSKHTHQSDHGEHTSKHGNHYKKLIVMTLASFLTMYILMYAMVNTFSNVLPNVNQFFMSGLMTSAMVIIELAIMGSMYMNRKLNAMIMAGTSIAILGFFLLIQQQTAVNDKQFLKSMIPHHAAAILMCQEANIKDSEIKKLCENIRLSQQREIDQMKSKLQELKSNGK